MEFIVVKHAGRYWDKYFSNDPKLSAQPLARSAALTHSGKKSNLEIAYTSKHEAEIACRRIMEFNPAGDYAVCNLLQDEGTVDDLIAPEDDSLYSVIKSVLNYTLFDSEFPVEDCITCADSSGGANLPTKSYFGTVGYLCLIYNRNVGDFRLDYLHPYIRRDFSGSISHKRWFKLYKSRDGAEYVTLDKTSWEGAYADPEHFCELGFVVCWKKILTDHDVEAAYEKNKAVCAELA